MTQLVLSMTLTTEAPQWSRPRIGRMTCPGKPVLTVPRLAAMEPAEDRPDDLQQQAVLQGYKGAAMEPAEDRPDDLVDQRARPGALHAAMEPAEDRPDDDAP